MKGRTGFALGVAVGFVLGARAGRRLNGQLENAASHLGSPEPAQTLGDTTSDPRSRMQQVLSDSLRATSRLLRAS